MCGQLLPSPGIHLPKNVVRAKEFKAGEVIHVSTVTSRGVAIEIEDRNVVGNHSNPEYPTTLHGQRSWPIMLLVYVLDQATVSRSPSIYLAILWEVLLPAV